MQKKSSAAGFSLANLLAVILIIIALGATGWYVWHAKQVSNKPSTNAASTSATTKPTSATKPADPYAGWKTQCDIYRYCFKYPANWNIAIFATAEKPCDAGEINLTSPDGKVKLDYINDNNKDGGGLIGSYTITKTLPLVLSNQNLTIIGGYATAGGNQYPSYNLIDTPSSAQSITVGNTLDMPTTITDQGVGSLKCMGAFGLAPAKPLGLVEAKSWFTSSDVQAGLTIMKSFYYE